MPTENEILTRLSDVVAVLKRAVAGGRLTTGEAVEALDVLNGLEATLADQPHTAYLIFNAAQDLAHRASLRRSPNAGPKAP